MDGKSLLKKALGKSLLGKALGERLVFIARSAISDLGFSDFIGVKKGVFVTLQSYPERRLRGCIGFIEPVELGEGICNAARGAAFHDPRFESLNKDEKYIIDVSILEKPKLINDVNEIKIGRDGLIVEDGYKKGLLLPQVAVEHGLDRMEFLENCCLKAGLDKDNLRGYKVYSFKASVFSEEKPCGRVIKKFK